MTSEYYGVFIIVTSMIPQMVIVVLAPIIIIGLAVRFMRNPERY